MMRSEKNKGWVGSEVGQWHFGSLPPGDSLNLSTADLVA